MNGRRLDNQEISISDDTDGYLKRIGCPPSWILTLKFLTAVHFGYMFRVSLLNFANTVTPLQKHRNFSMSVFFLMKCKNSLPQLRQTEYEYSSVT